MPFAVNRSMENKFYLYGWNVLYALKGQKHLAQGNTLGKAMLGCRLVLGAFGLWLSLRPPIYNSARFNRTGRTNSIRTNKRNQGRLHRRMARKNGG